MSQVYIPKTPQEKLGIAQWVCSRTKESMPDVFEAIAVIHEGKMAAGILYYDYFGKSINLSLTSETPRAASKTVFKVMLGYPFKQLKVKRITALIKKGNKRSRKLAEGLGFKLEGVVRKATPEGKDLCIYGLLDDEYFTGRFV